METTLSKLADSVDDVSDEEKEQLLRIAQNIYWNDDANHSLRPQSIIAMRYISCNDQAEHKTAEYLYSVLGSNQELKILYNRL